MCMNTKIIDTINRRRHRYFTVLKDTTVITLMGWGYGSNKIENGGNPVKNRFLGGTQVSCRTPMLFLKHLL